MNSMFENSLKGALPWKKEPDINFSLAMELQCGGMGLTRIATEIFDFKKIEADGGEVYLENPITRDIMTVVRNRDGLEVGIFAFNAVSCPQLNAVRFVMQHERDICSPLAAVDFIRGKLNPAP